MKSPKAFTLIELLVVISIIGVLSSVVLASLNAAREKGRLGAGKQFEASVYHVEGDQALGLWDFDECTGNVVKDWSGNNRNGALAGTAVWPTDTPSGQGCALSFDGSTNSVSLGNTSAFDFDSSTSFTISVWVKSGSGMIFSNQTSGGNAGVGINMLSSGGFFGPRFAVTYGTFSGDWAHSINMQPALTIPNGQWTQVVAVVDQASKVGHMYIDGKLVNIIMIGGSCGTITGSTLDYSSCPVVANHSTITYIGTTPFGGLFSGTIDQLRVYAKALTASEVGKLYASEASHFKFASK